MLKKKQKTALKLFLEGRLNQKEIAQQIGVTEQTIINWKKNEEFMAEFDAEIKGKFSIAAGRALKKELELLECAESESVCLNAAKDILDRAGFKADSLVKISTDDDGTLKEMREYFEQREKENI